jgi:hypothetical protein
MNTHFYRCFGFFVATLSEPQTNRLLHALGLNGDFTFLPVPAEAVAASINSSQTDLKLAAVPLNAEGAEVLVEDAKAVIFLCDLCEILRDLCV